MRDGRTGLPTRPNATSAAMPSRRTRLMRTDDTAKAEDVIESIWAAVTLVPAMPFLIGYFLAVAVVHGLIKIGRLVTTGRINPRSKPTPPQRPQQSPRYFAHGPDGSIIGEYDTVEAAEIAGLLACGVKAVDLPLTLHERRRLGTYGAMYEEERTPQPQPRPEKPPRLPFLLRWDPDRRWW
jgi:hypothetical protein